MWFCAAISKILILQGALRPGEPGGGQDPNVASYAFMNLLPYGLTPVSYYDIVNQKSYGYSHERYSYHEEEPETAQILVFSEVPQIKKYSSCGKNSIFGKSFFGRKKRSADQSKEFLFFKM